MLLLEAIDRSALESLLARYGLTLVLVPEGDVIPGSYWGDREAGLIGGQLYARSDTPLHSVLHEAAHFACMPSERRSALHTDAGGDEAEENAVCYLQILWAACLPSVGRERMCRDMDEWGYSFRLGSAATWFAEDAAEAAGWLAAQGLVDHAGRPTYAVR